MKNMSCAIFIICLICSVNSFANNFVTIEGSDQVIKVPPDYMVTPEQLKAVHEDATLKIPQLIQKYGYPCERHVVITDDDYILELHRIPYGPGPYPPAPPPPGLRPPILLVHGLFSSSAAWVLPGPEKAFAYLLAQQGYDVWLANTRGNIYSRKHKYLDPDIDGKYWSFSWHELGTHDLPAMIDYILAKTQQAQLFYVGHSQGSTAFFVMGSEKPDYNKKIKASFALGPVAYMGHVVSPLLRFITYYLGIDLSNIEYILNILGVYEFKPNGEYMKEIAQKFCSDDSITQFLCSNYMFLGSGFNADNLNNTLLPVYYAHVPTGASSRQALHYAQEMKSGEFRYYDYGKISNLWHYGSLWPPAYDLSKVTAPVAIHYGLNDWMVGIEDVVRLGNELPNLIGMFKAADKKFNHMDFIWGINAPEMIYEKIFTLMKVAK